MTVEQDDQQIETMIFPATFTKHFVTTAANQTKRKMKNNRAPRTTVCQGKRGDSEHAHNISWTRKVYKSNFQLFLFEIPPLKN